MIDRRGSKKPEPAEKPLTIVEAPEPRGEGTWEEICYAVVLAQAPGGNIMVLGRAVGLRDDGEVFVADWILPPIWKEGTRWEQEAKKRLDTFVDCNCKHGGQACVVHKMYLPQWAQQDTQRLELIDSEPVPKPLEVLMKAEASRAAAKPNIVVSR